MLQLIREIYKSRELIWALSLKELRVRYKRSVLGFIWALLNPLLMMAVLTVVFSTITTMNIHGYAIFLLSALLPWSFFTQTLSYSVESIVSNAELLKKVRIPKAVFPLAAIVSNVINFLLSLLPMIIIVLLMRFPLHWTWFFLPIPLIALILFTAGCAFFFAIANVFFRDVSHIIQIILSAWFYLSPVLYSLDFLPHRYHLFFRLNPMLYLLNGFRMAIYYGHLPSLANMAASLGLGLIALAAGFAVFRRFEKTAIFYI